MKTSVLERLVTLNIRFFAKKSSLWKLLDGSILILDFLDRYQFFWIDIYIIFFCKSHLCGNCWMDRAPSNSLMDSLSLDYLSRNQNRLKISKLSKISYYGESKILYIIHINSYTKTFWINFASRITA